MKQLDRSFWRNMWQLTQAYWHSEEKWQARGLLAVIIGLNLGFVYILVLLNQWNNVFYNTLQNYDKSGFWDAILEFCIIAFAYIVVAVYKLYLQQMLEIKWRRWMTDKYVGDWLKNRTYYKMQLVDQHTDNPDQRISEDLNLFTSLTLRISLGLLRSIVTLVSFVAILWQLSGPLAIPFGSVAITIPGYMVWVALVYAVIGTWLTDKIGRPLANLNFNQQRLEADFRYSLIRLRENSESIAFYRGEPQEGAGFRQRFVKVYDNFWKLMQQQKQLTWFTSGYGQIAIIFPLLVAAPRYFTKQIQLGGLIQISSAFGRVQDALSFIVETYPTLAEWQAVGDRLIGFTQNIERVQEGHQSKPQMEIACDHAEGLSIQGLNTGLPDGKVLINRLEMELKPGDSLLISGPSGSGKSTLMRTLAGIWPFSDGAIQIPQGHTTFFLPQKSYLPLGTLRDVLIYPRTASVPDDVLKETLRQCKLEWLKDQLNTIEDWSRILSLGEQQRIAFARAILSHPQWLFLDEATSALDEPTERHMYQLVQEKLPHTAIISVGHRSTLREFHKKKLLIEGNGKWNLLH